MSHVFQYQRNRNGTYTYWGATGDFNLGERGRNAIDVYKVTLPAPQPAACPAQTRSKRARVRGGRRTTIRAKVTRYGRPVRGAKVTAKGPGFTTSARTNARGEATFRVRPRRSGRATVSTRVCEGSLAVRVRSQQQTGPRFTG